MSLIEIILKVKAAIKDCPSINAMWLEGSYATGFYVANSDIDVWIDVVPGSQKESYDCFCKAVNNVVPISDASMLDHYSDQPTLHKAKIYLDGKSNANRVELDIQESTRDFIFSRKDHDIVVMFDKTGAIQYCD